MTRPGPFTRGFGWLQRHAVTVMAGSLFVGLVFPPVATLLSPIVFPFAMLTMMFALLRVDWPLVSAYLRRPALPLGIALGALVVVPTVTALLANALGAGDAPLAIGMTLVAATPPLLSAPAYALMLGVDGALALVVAVPASLLTPLVMPPVVSGLAGIDLDISTVGLTTRLAVIVGFAFAGALAVRRVAGVERVHAHAAFVDGTMILLLCTFGIGVMDGIAALVLAEPGKALAYIGGAFALSAGMQVLGTLAFMWLGARVALTAGLVWGFRNGILVLAAVGDSAGPDVKLFLVCYQFPLYMMPLIARPIFARILARNAGRGPGHRP